MLRNINVKKQLTFGILLIIFIGSLSSATQSSNNNILTTGKLLSIPLIRGDIIYVDDDNIEGPWDGTLEHPYKEIQDGIDNAISGDTVFVFNGTYQKEIVVPNLKEINIIGEDRNNTKITAKITVFSNKVNLIGFTTNFVELDGANYCFIYGNKMLDGLRIWDSAHVTIRNNNISNSYYYGLYIEYYDSNSISIINNIIEGNRGWNIRLSGGNHIITGNIIRNSHRMGFFIFCYDSFIKNNTISYNGDGIWLSGRNNIIINNDINNNRGFGFKIIGDDNIICGNNINDNEGYGIETELPEIPWDWVTEGNIIYQNNFINNTAHHEWPKDPYYTGINFWYNPILNKGNYWFDYTGEDNDGDGIGDTPYEILPKGRSKDRFPFMEPVDIDNVTAVYDFSKVTMIRDRIVQNVQSAAIEEQIQKQTVTEEETELLWGPFSHIGVTVNEIYGDVDAPQYRLLPDVEVMAIGVSFMNFGDTLNDTTRENGECTFLTIMPGNYLIKVSKDGYTDISSGVKQFRIIEAPMASSVDVTFILTKDESPFTKQIIQSCQGSFNLLFLRIFDQFPLLNLLLQRLRI